MTKSRKVELLYKKAKGQSLHATKEELRELKQYKIESSEGSFYTTKSNVREYVNAVDNQGYQLSFYTWCINNSKADRRKSGASEKEMKQSSIGQEIACMLLGSATWGHTIHEIFQGILSSTICTILGACLSVFLCKCFREKVGNMIIGLPILLLVIFYQIF